MKIPVVDYHDPTYHLQLDEAFRTVGFCYMKTDLKVDEILEYAKYFFDLPLTIKNQLAYTSTEHNTGYQGMTESLTPGTPPDLKEAFNWCEYGPNTWLDERHKMMCEYWCVSLLGWTNQVLHAIEEALGLEKFSLIHQHLESKSTTTRMLHYPPWNDEIEKNQMRGGAHTDYGTITLLFTDGSPGLQIQPRGTDGWITAPHVPNAFLINVGDLLQRWTNDRYMSTPHRVVNNNLDKSRYSFAHFVHPKDEIIVDSLVGESKYEPIGAKDYLVWRLNQSY